MTIFIADLMELKIWMHRRKRSFSIGNGVH